MRTRLVTALKRQATELLSDLEMHREPIVISQHGLLSDYPFAVENCELLQKRVTLLDGIARGEEGVEKGRTLSHARARHRLARWLK
jgi:hypothetical protein